MRRAGWATAFLIITTFVTALAWTGAAQARQAPLMRAICDPGLIEGWRSDGPQVVQEFATRLGADAVRINLRWSESEQKRGVYDEDYLGRALQAVRAINERGMRAAIVVYEPPRWASDRSVWNRPVTGDRAGVYQKYYPPSADSLDAFEAFARHVAEKLRGEVLSYSCWVEPNLWCYIYPQRTSSDSGFAAHRYAAMLAAFSRGIRAGDPAALVVAGETSPTGENSRLRTSPQRFARLLRDRGAGSYFDVYAHHPYPGAGNKRISPGAMPRDPSQTVWLANLPTLLRIFPDKPFYLSEFAYSTKPNIDFGVWVSATRQASYLTTAYRLAAKYSQVQMLTWFPRRDHSPSGSYRDLRASSAGLRALNGSRKRAYYAFARGNHLTMNSISHIRRGASFRLRGRLTSDRMGALAGKSLDVLAKRPGRSWVRITRIHTRSDGSYSVRLRPQRSAAWKVRWAGVVSGPKDWIPVRAY